MKRNLLGFGLLGLFYIILFHRATNFPYIGSFIILPPLTMAIGLITIPPIVMLTREYVMNYNYDDSNIVITVSIVQISVISSVLLLGSTIDTSNIHNMMGYWFLAITFGIDLIAFFLEIFKPWVIVLVLLHIMVFFLLGLFSYMDPFYVQVLVVYLLIHTIFSISYAALRHGYSIKKIVEYIYDTYIYQPKDKA